MCMAFQDKMKVTSIFILFSFFLFASSVYGSSIAKHYIVYMGLHSLPDSETVINSNHEMLSSVVGSVDEARNAIIHHYHKSFRGFSAMLKPEEAEQLRNHSSVFSVFESTTYELQTTRSWNFLMDHTTGFGRGLFKHFRGGKKHHVVVGHFDSGIWPESQSFSDRGLGHVPDSFKGECVEGEQFKSHNCNRKIVGARYYADGYEALKGPLDSDGRPYYRSARDDWGHGTQTASIAVGAEVRDITVDDMSKLTAQGGAVQARVAVYKTCWFGYCVCSDILKAFDDAIYDGVNLIGFAGGQPSPLDYFEDCFAIGAFHAFQNGIVSVAAGGNYENGYAYAYSSSYGNVVNGAPWIFTVAASTIDREFVNSVTLGNHFSLSGHASNEYRLNGSHSLISGGHAARHGISEVEASYCKRHTLDHLRVKGKIVVCRMKNWDDNRREKSEEVKKTGGIGMIIIDQGDSAKVVDNYDVPTSIIGKEEGRRLLDYMSRHWRPTSSISYTKTVLNSKPAPKMAFFSSKGPNRITPDIIKPDLTAPGFNIIGAWPPSSHEKPNAISYAFNSGTSMSAPHVLGVAAVIKATNRRWSPAIIKSALMTSASLLDNTRNPILAADGDTLATPFNFGSGHLEPNDALTPGLVYDWSRNDLIDFLCYQTRNEWKLQHLIGKPVGCKNPLVPPYQLNYPSIAVSNLDRIISVYRTATFVATRNGPQVYKVSIEYPEGVDVRVEPSVLDFTDGRRKITYRVDLIPRHRSDDYVFGSITWSDGGRHHVRSPIAVRVV